MDSKPNFVDFINQSPFKGLEITFEREQSPIREIDIKHVLDRFKEQKIKDLSLKNKIS